MVRGRPFWTVVAWLKVTVPKLSRGRSKRLPAVGDSSIHSAEEREDRYVRWVWNVSWRVLSAMTISQVPFDCCVSETIIVSAASTVMGTGWEAWGSVSHQAV